MSEVTTEPKGDDRSRLRIVGFKVIDQSVSPTSVIIPGEDCLSTPAQLDSPKSSLAAALRANLLKPFPKLAIKTTPRRNYSLRKSLSHADIHRSYLGANCNGSPATPSSRTSTTSTPMRIPSGSVSTIFVLFHHVDSPSFSCALKLVLALRACAVLLECKRAH